MSQETADWAGVPVTTAGEDPVPSMGQLLCQMLTWITNGWQAQGRPFKCGDTGTQGSEGISDTQQPSVT